MEKNQLTIQELEQIMQEHGVVIRAIPNKTRSVLETCHADLYPHGQVIHLEEYGREMLVVEEVPRNAGKFLIESVRSTCANVCFNKRYFDSIEDAVEALLNGTAKSPNYTERKKHDKSEDSNQI